MSDDAHTLRINLPVEDCGVVYLLDEDPEQVGGSPYPSRSLIGTGRGSATLEIATQWGDIPFTVCVAGRDPGADVDGYEDIVEADFDSPSGRAFLMGWSLDQVGERTLRLPPLPAGPGTYRLRYHLRGLDEERCAPDDHYLQIWPAPRQGPAIVKATSAGMNEILRSRLR